MKTFLIDGSNVVRTWNNTNGWINYQQEDRENSRFIRFLEHLNRFGHYRVEVYFDGPTRNIVSHNGLVEVIFSHRKKADELIVNAAYETVNTYQQKAVVITQDNNLIERCTALGAYVKQTRQFLQEIQSQYVVYA